jgi:thiol:disulfide interchange protein DsbD
LPVSDSDSDYIEAVQGTDLLSHGVSFAFGTAFVGGFLTSLTPCVYPLIPITVTLFGAREEHVSRARAMGLAAAYVSGMGAMYAALGIFSALAGKGFGTQLAKPWVVFPIALLFLVMAASMFGAFELSLPQVLQERLHKVGGKGPGGAFGMGLVGGIIAAPCTGPVLASILAYVATTHSVGLGAGLLFTYALGMGVLFFLIAAFAIGLPKSGTWMDAVKSIFGISMIIAALYFARPLVRPLSTFAAHTPRAMGTAIALMGVGAALGAIHLSFSWTTTAIRVRKALGLIFFTVGAWQALLWFMTPPPGSPLAWAHEIAAVDAAKADHKPVVLDFGAEWCPPCKELEVRTFPKVADELQRFQLVKIDCTNEDDPSVVAAKKRFGAGTLPAVFILDSDGNVKHHIDHFIMPDVMRPMLTDVE